MSAARHAPVESGGTTAALVERLKQRSDARAERSVEEELPTGPVTVAVVPGSQSAVSGEGNADAISHATQSSTTHKDRRPVHGPDGRLELYGERVVKLTLDLPRALVDALARWERDETVATGRRVYRERLIDCALTALPNDFHTVLELSRALPESIRSGELEQVGTRVRETIYRRFQGLRPELRVRRVRDIYLRHIYAAALYRYLNEAGIPIEAAPITNESALLETGGRPEPG